MPYNMSMYGGDKKGFNMEDWIKECQDAFAAGIEKVGCMLPQVCDDGRAEVMVNTCCAP